MSKVFGHISDEVLDLLMYGADRKAWINLSHGSWSPANSVVIGGAGSYHNVDNTDFRLYTRLTIPLLKGTKKLYITGLRFRVGNADAGDYIDYILVEGRDLAGVMQTINYNDGDFDAVANISYTFTAVDCSSYYEVQVEMVCVATNTDDLIISRIQLQVYYDD